jgi:hypothetical protein
MPAVQFFARLDLNPIGRFLDGHYLGNLLATKNISECTMAIVIIFIAANPVGPTVALPTNRLATACGHESGLPCLEGASGNVV